MLLTTHRGHGKHPRINEEPGLNAQALLFLLDLSGPSEPLPIEFEEIRSHVGVERSERLVLPVLPVLFFQIPLY